MSNLSYVRHVGDGVTLSYLLAVSGTNIGYFRTTDIHAFVDGVEVSMVINPASPHLAVLTVAPALGSDVLIRRVMPVDKTYADFARGNNFGHRQVNNTFLQQLYLSQELLDGFTPLGFYYKQDIDMGKKTLVNLPETEDKTAALSYAQIVKVIGEQFTAYDPDKYIDYGLITEEVADTRDYGGLN